MPIWQKNENSRRPRRLLRAERADAGRYRNPFAGQLHSGMIDQNANRLFEQIRQAVPVVDAAIGKIIRLVAALRLSAMTAGCSGSWTSSAPGCRWGRPGIGLPQFLYGYLDDLLTYGNAAGETLDRVLAGKGLARCTTCRWTTLRWSAGKARCSCAFPAFRTG